MNDQTSDNSRHQALTPQARRTVTRAIRCLEAAYSVKGEAISGPQDARDYFKLRLYGLPFEVFACLLLDNRHRVIRFAELFRGTIDGASVHPREVVRLAMEANAAAVILAHSVPRNRMRLMWRDSLCGASRQSFDRAGETLVSRAHNLGVVGLVSAAL